MPYLGVHSRSCAQTWCSGSLDLDEPELISLSFSDVSLVVEMNTGVQAKGFRKSHVELMVPGLDNRLSIKPVLSLC